MSKDRLFEKLRVFVASPSDVGKQRDRVNHVAERLNRTGGPAHEAGVVLEVMRWESHVAPLMGKPQEVILEQLPTEDWDIFVGILWSRFGSPTGSSAPGSGEDYGSGTEQEFDLAYRAWAEKSRPQILLYRCVQLPADRLDRLDFQQLERLAVFFDRFGPKGPTPGFYSSFSQWEEFEIRLEQDLAKVLRKICEARSAGQPEPKPSLPPPIQGDDSSSLSDLKEGMPYEIAFLSLDIAEHSSIVRRHIDNQKAVRSTLRSFLAMATEVAKRYNGEVFSWAGDGGLLAFWGDNHQERAILAGIRLLYNLPIFNLDPTQNQIGEAISVRLAANEVLIIFQLPTHSITAVELNVTVHLQEKFTTPGEFCVTDTILTGIRPEIRDRFAFKGRLEGRSISSYRQLHSRQDPASDTLKSLTEHALRTGPLIRGILQEFQGESTSNKQIFEQLSALLEQFYSELQKLCSSLGAIDDRWSTNYCQELLQYVSQLLEEENLIWESLRSRYLQLEGVTGEEGEFEAITQTISRKRSMPFLLLGKLRATLERRVGGYEASSGHQEARSLAATQLQRFLRSDELEQETCLTDLLLSSKEFLIDSALQEKPGARKSVLLDRLWQLADLLLQDDLYSLRRYRRHNERRLGVVLTHEPLRDTRFISVSKMLELPEILSLDTLTQQLTQQGSPATREDIETFLRCIAVAHSDASTQRFAVYSLPLLSIWQLVARETIPLSLLYTIGLRFKRVESEEFQKIFCDCTRGRMLKEVQATDDRRVVAELTKIVLLMLEFGFMVETSYFERFDDLLSHFLFCVKRAGLKIDYFERVRSQFDAARIQKGSPTGSVPKGIRNLPLSLQRRLAGEGPYLIWFVGHPDPRVAMETLRHISLSNIERVLKVPEVNSSLLHEILKRSEFFGRSSLLLLALSHPKCTTEFARMHLAALGRSRQGNAALVSLARNGAANPVIRSMAQTLVARRPSN